jgi:4'-phosphopantetheinyl transferase
MRKIYIENINNIKINNDLIDIISYTDDKMKEVSLKGWSLLSYIIYKKYNMKLTKDMICYNDNKKPYFKDSKIYFNISHSKDLIAIIIDNKECGIDIEYIDYNKQLDKLALKVLSEKEIIKYNIKKDKVKLIYVMNTLNKWYIKRVLKKDLKEIMHLMQNGENEYRNNKRKLYYQFTLMTALENLDIIDE